MTTHRLLIPTDLSVFGAAALRYGAALRTALEASMTIVYADEPPPVASMPDLPVYPSQRAVEEKKEILERLRQHVEANVPPPLPDLRVSHEPATQAILEAAEAADASLILMGTHGRRGWRRLVLGSVTENVLRQSQRPVLTIGPAALQVTQPRFATVLCPVNFSVVALQALREAGVMASRLDADLIVLHVAEPGQATLSLELERELSAWIDPQLRGRCRYRQLVAAGRADERVLQIADRFEADLLVIGAQHRRFRDSTVMGTTTERIVRFAPMPVMTISLPAEEGVRIHAA